MIDCPTSSSLIEGVAHTLGTGSGSGQSRAIAHTCFKVKKRNVYSINVTFTFFSSQSSLFGHLDLVILTSLLQICPYGPLR